MSVLKTILLSVTLLGATAALAQTNLNLGGFSADPTAPVEITAETLTVDQDSGTAIFEGNVVAAQGELRLSASRVQVIYDDTAGDISHLYASGGVTIVTETEAAEADSAEYNLDAGTLTMTNDVLLTQGPSAISGDILRVDLDTGSAQMDGNVRTILNQGDN